MDRPAHPADVLLSIAAALLIATLLTPVVRTVTIGLDTSLGRVWPFSMQHGFERGAERPIAALPPRHASGYATR